MSLDSRSYEEAAAGRLIPRARSGLRALLFDMFSSTFAPHLALLKASELGTRPLFFIFKQPLSYFLLRVGSPLRSEIRRTLQVHFLCFQARPHLKHLESRCLRKADDAGSVAATESTAAIFSVTLLVPFKAEDKASNSPCITEFSRLQA